MNIERVLTLVRKVVLGFVRTIIELFFTHKPKVAKIYHMQKVATQMNKRWNKARRMESAL